MVESRYVCFFILGLGLVGYFVVVYVVCVNLELVFFMGI